MSSHAAKCIDGRQTRQLAACELAFLVAASWLLWDYVGQRCWGESGTASGHVSAAHATLGLVMGNF